MPALKTYDPGLYTVTFLGNTISGWADGTFLQAEKNEQSFTVHVGVDGEASRARTRNRSGKVTLTLAQTSASNDILSAAVQADEEGGEGVGALLIEDGNGTTVLSAAAAWVQKPANVELGKEVGNREWVIETGKFDKFTVGGTTELA